MTTVFGLLRRLVTDSTDNFGRVTSGELTDLIDVAGEKDFTPERLRYYKDGTRRFLQYGTDANFSETNYGQLLEPDADQTLTLTAAERAAYPVSIDLWPSMARRVTQDPQAGDVVAGGYGELDLDNFDPSAVDYNAVSNPAAGAYSGTDADGYFWMHTATTGRDSALFVGVSGGTVFDSFVANLPAGADVLTIMEQRLNCYGVGPSLFRETFTNVDGDRLNPQENVTITSVANDDGTGSELFSHRLQMGVKQAAGNTGLGLEAGSMSVKASSMPFYKFKRKGHGMTLNVTATDTYQAVGAIRGDPNRPGIKLRLDGMEISTTPGTGTNDTEVLIAAVDPAETNADSLTFDTPIEHNPTNSVVEIVEDNTITAPDEDGAGTDVTGPDTANTVANPGGYQIGRETVGTEGEGNKNVARGPQSGTRDLYDTDIALVLVNAESTGTCVIDIQTSQNS